MAATKGEGQGHHALAPSPAATVPDDRNHNAPVRPSTVTFSDLTADLFPEAPVGPDPSKLTGQLLTTYQFMRIHGSIDQGRGFLEAGIGHVSSRITELVELGFKIKKTWAKSANGKKFKVYSLEAA